MKTFFSKMRGVAKSPPMVRPTEIFWSWLGSVTGIGLCGFVSSLFFEIYDMTLIIGSFGASAVLVYAAIKSPLAQPRNLIGGHIISAFVGVFCFKTFGPIPWLAGSLAVSFAIAAMLATKTLHPPGGATALIAVIGSPVIHNLGYFYAIVPVGLGALVLLIIALFVNNMAPTRRYPEFWV